MLDLAAENLFDSTQFPETEVAVNRSDLVDEVADATGSTKVQAETAVAAFVDAVIADVKAGTRVTIFGFGTHSYILGLEAMLKILESRVAGKNDSV